MRRPEGTTDLFQEFSIVGHESHHSREEHHIKATLLLGSSRVRSARRQAPRVPWFRTCRRSVDVVALDRLPGRGGRGGVWATAAPGVIAVIGTGRAKSWWGEERRKVNVGNNMPEICNRRRTEIRTTGCQWVTHEKVSGTFFLEEAIQRNLEGLGHGF